MPHNTTKNHHQKTVHFAPESPVQFDPELPVQFKPELGVQFEPEYPFIGFSHKWVAFLAKANL